MISVSFIFFSFSSAIALLLTSYVAYHVIIAPRFNPLRKLAGPPLNGPLHNHMSPVLDPFRSPRTHAAYVEKYGRNVRIRGLGPWDERLLPLDPVSVAHVLKNSTIYEKPWQSRRLITSLIGCGMLAAEGHVHKRQRRVATPAFSIQNMRALVPLVFSKGEELKDKWMNMSQAVASEKQNSGQVEIDICHWISRATFDVIGLAAFLLRIKEMFEIAVSQGDAFRTVMGIYFPILNRLFKTIRRVAGKLVQQKKSRIMDGEKSGSDTTSLALTWTFLLLAKHPDLQTRLRKELLSIMPTTPISRLSCEEIESLHNTLQKLTILEQFHSSLRVATQDDEIPVSYPVHLSDGTISEQKSISVSKGSFVHVPVEAFNLDKGIPDRWDHLSEDVLSLPGLYSNLLTFSAGPRSCIGMRFSMIEMKTFLYILLTTFSFAETDKRIYKANFKKGSQCPLIVTPLESIAT
ncbi:cytochrome P450 [Suillus bovinus]|uniref:cytochrome P450 n=1 Tax=Suillus bovinus TaxID=48563 RepID=UPI001B875674|nr:cytochrome P450 [Suillus bovinus]KAG2146409.1 cytochrome P450 [Suillus bovinus]